MTVNQETVHLSTISIPAPLYEIGQQVEWITGEYPMVVEFRGVVTGQTYHIDYKGGNWNYTMAITRAVSTGKFLENYAGGNYPNIAENRLRGYIRREYTGE